MIIDTRYHMTLKECAPKLGLSYATLYNYRTYGVLPFPKPYFEGWGAKLYDIRVLRKWYKKVPPPGTGPKRPRKSKQVEHSLDINGREHVTQTEIAKRLGVTRSAVSNWVTRHDFPEALFFGRTALRPWEEVVKWYEERNA